MKESLLTMMMLNACCVGCGLSAAGTGAIGCGGPPFTSADSGEGGSGQDAGMDSSNGDDASETGTNDGSSMDAANDSSDAMTVDSGDAATINDSGNDADSGPSCSMTGSWDYEPGLADASMPCYTAFIVNGNTCVPPPASTPDGVCETVQCANSPNSGDNVFIWTGDTQTVINAPPGKIGQVLYLVVPSQPTCSDMAALISSPNWMLATVNTSGSQQTFTAPGASGQPRAYWITAL